MIGARRKLLYIAGSGRSGTTILAAILGQVRGFFSVGEVYRLWERALVGDGLCGCGVPFRRCETWVRIFDAAFGGMDVVDPRRMVELRERFTQTKRLANVVVRRGRPPEAKGDLGEYLTALDRLYSAIGQVTGCDVIVDSSKWPTYAHLLEQVPSVDLYVLHLVRDPRAVAFSWTRAKDYEAGKPLGRQGAAKTTAYWVAWNQAISLLWGRRPSKYLFLRYERFVSRPREALAEIVRFVEVGGRELPFATPEVIDLSPTHAVAGNAERFASGSIRLRLDDRWLREMPWLSRSAVGICTAPWRFRYSST